MSCQATVLLVDDDLENQWALPLAPEGSGHHVLLAGNGRNALRKADAAFPKLVVTDFQMPEMDGRELCRRPKSRAMFSDITVVPMSAMPEPGDEIRCWSAFFGSRPR
jgi:CheY-like chemotaxis protein